MLLEPHLVRVPRADHDGGAVVMWLHQAARWLGLPHWYLSTGCLHGGTGHAYCQGRSGAAGAKTPAVCKFCGARCRCRCHRTRGGRL